MEELRSQDLEEVIDELEDESAAEEARASEVDQLLGQLQPPHLYVARQRAAEQLGEVGESNLQIVQALIRAGESDSFDGVKRAVVESLHAPAHQEILSKHPRLAQRAESVACEVAAVRIREEQAFEAAERRSTVSSSRSSPWLEINASDEGLIALFKIAVTSLRALLEIAKALPALFEIAAAGLERLSPGQRLGVAGGAGGFVAGSFAALGIWSLWGDAILFVVPTALVLGPLVGLLFGWGGGALVRRYRPGLELAGWVFGSLVSAVAAAFLSWWAIAAGLSPP